MAKAITSTTKFASRGGNPAHGLALIYDLEGFSKFFNQPDVQDYVPKFLNHVSQAISVVLLGGTAYWDADTPKYQPLPAPIHEKFLVVATKIRGFPEEIVIVDKLEYEALGEDQRVLFRDL